MSKLSQFWAKVTTWRRVTTPRGFKYSSGVAVTDETSMKVAAFYRGLMYISSQIAKLPWNVKNVDNKIQSSHVVQFLLNTAPNNEMNSFRFKLFMIQQAILAGNAYAEIERNLLGKVIALWPLMTSRMEVKRDEYGRLIYKYTNEDGSISILEPRDVFHLPNFHTLDGITGQGLVAYATETLGIQLAADQMASGLFKNGGIPSGILKHKGKISEEALKRLKESWGKESGGANSGGTKILEEDMSYETVKIDAEMLQFLDSRKFGVLEIARFLGISPIKLFDTSAATYSNAEQANLEATTDTIHTWATNLEAEANVKLLNYEYGKLYTDIDLYQVSRGDMKTRADYFKTMIGIGTMTPNEVRDLEGMEGYAEGDNFYIATNNFTPVNRMDEVIDAQIKSKTQPQQPQDPKPKDEPTETEKALLQAAKDFLESR